MLFNFRTKNPNRTVNHEGAEAFRLTPKMELYSAVVTASLGDGFYEKGADRLARIVELIGQNDSIFVAKLAIYARERMHLRSVPLVLAVELAKKGATDGTVSRLTERVIQRADEITELLAFYAQANGRTGKSKQLGRLSKQLQKGIAAAFNKFDEHQFAKYDRPTAIRLRDALFLAHPTPKSTEQQAIFDRIAAQTLAVPYTWETELSALGQQNFANEAAKKAAFRAKWAELIDSSKLGYMALLRNLRNILEADVAASQIEKVCARLADAAEVQRSKQLPFRFLAAFREVSKIQSGHVGIVLAALEKAAISAAANLRGFGAATRVTIACDVSGSMQKPISAKSTVLLYDIGLMLGMLLQTRCRSVEAGMFGDSWKIVRLPTDRVLTNVQEFYRREGEVGYSTNGHLAIADLLARRAVREKVMLFTDCQLWNSTGDGGRFSQIWLEYRQKVAPEAKLYLFDLAGLGSMPLDLSHAANGVHLIAGWSDKVFDVLAALDAGGGEATKLIDAIDF